MGPSAVRVAGLGRRLAQLGHDVEDYGNIPVVQPENITDPGSPKARNLAEITEACGILGELAAQALESGRTPLVLGGDHSIAAGSISGVSRHFRKAGYKIGLIWIDAHADMNTPQSTPSGNVHGMPLAALAGLDPCELSSLFGFQPKVDPANIVLVGLRDVDEKERTNVRNSGVHAFTMRDLDEAGMRNVIEQAIAFATTGTAGFHLSLDMDFVDPEIAPGVGTAVPGGGTYRETHLAMEMICDSGRLVSMDVVEVNPILDSMNRTADLAVELVQSAMGKRIL
jgi:arginase